MAVSVSAIERLFGLLVVCWSIHCSFRRTGSEESRLQLVWSMVCNSQIEPSSSSLMFGFELNWNSLDSNFHCEEVNGILLVQRLWTNESANFWCFFIEFDCFFVDCCNLRWIDGFVLWETVRFKRFQPFPSLSKGRIWCPFRSNSSISLRIQTMKTSFLHSWIQLSFLHWLWWLKLLSMFEPSASFFVQTFEEAFPLKWSKWFEPNWIIEEWAFWWSIQQ